MGYVEELRALVGRRPLVLAGACVIVLDDDGRVLLHRRADSGAWDIMGGAMEPGETFEQTARRELREETGLEAGALSLLQVYSGPAFFHRYPNGDEVFHVGAAFITRDVRGEPDPDPREVRELRAFDLDALPDPLDPLARTYLERLRRGPPPVSWPDGE